MTLVSRYKSAKSRAAPFCYDTDVMCARTHARKSLISCPWLFGTDPAMYKSMNTTQTLTAENIKAAVAQLAVPGSRKALIADLHQVACPLDIDLDTFKAWLLEQHRAGRLELSRWDLRGTDPVVQESEITYMNATFHQVSR